MAKKDTHKRLEIWMEKIFHHRIKIYAANYNMSITKYVMQAITQQILRDEELSK